MIVYLSVWMLPECMYDSVCMYVWLCVSVCLCICECMHANMCVPLCVFVVVRA